MGIHCKCILSIIHPCRPLQLHIVCTVGEPSKFDTPAEFARLRPYANDARAGMSVHDGEPVVPRHSDWAGWRTPYVPPYNRRGTPLLQLLDAHVVNAIVTLEGAFTVATHVAGRVGARRGVVHERHKKPVATGAQLFEAQEIHGGNATMIGVRCHGTIYRTLRKQ